jgi:hypothetical protein
MSLAEQLWSHGEVLMNFKFKSAVAALIVISGTVPGHADPTLGQYVTLSGFGTLGEVHSDYREADFTGNFLQPSGAGFSRSWSYDPDTDLGVQADLNLGHGFSGVVQVLSRYDTDGNYSPEFEWANLKYAITSDLAVRVGRTLLPTYERSDSENVGYTLPWVRLPNEIRFSNSATHSDGVDLVYRLTTGSLTQDLQVQWGRTSEEFPGAVFNGKDLAVFSDTLRFGDTSVHVAYQSMNYTYAGTQPGQYQPPSLLQPGQYRLASMGFTYDPGKWFVTGDSNYAHYYYFGDFVAWYISGGVRLGQFTPYVIYSTEHAASSAPPSGLTSLGDEHTVSSGVRWDFAKNVDFKLQLQQVTIESLDAPASFTLVQRGVAQVGDKANVLSLTVDFVF